MERFADGWLNERDLRQEAAVRLFCLPHAGSGAGAYYRWKRLLPAGIAVCPVLLPGREMRLREPLVDDAGVMADGIVAAMTPFLGAPYAIFGHSMGAVLAYEVAMRMAERGLPGPACLYVSGRDAVSLPWRHRELHMLEDEAFVGALRVRYGGMPEAFLQDPELREVFLPILRADLQMVERYRFPERGLLGCRVRAFAGARDPSVTADGLAGWGGLTTGEFGVRRFAGDHFYHLGEGQGELVRVLGEMCGMVDPLPGGKS